MTDDRPYDDQPLDRLTAQIRAESLDEETVAAATARVWRRLEGSLGAGDEPLRGCADIRALLPDLAAGRLAGGRALLVSDHLRDCAPCRRALAVLRSGLAAVPPAPEEAAPPRRAVRQLWLAAAAVLVLGVGLVIARTVTDVVADHRLRATVASVDGTLLFVSDASASALETGATVRAAERLRTARRSGAVLRLGDGSTIEMAPRSELELRGARSGTTVDLVRGNIIVHAAPQRHGRLLVKTADCRVAVKGTIFAVSSGLKGSRVAVIQGEVEVRRAAGRELLSPGQQLTTNDRLERVPISDQIAWSRNADEHLELLRQLGALQRDVLAAMEPAYPRTSTELLDLAPPDTVAYVAVPNLAEGITDGRALLEQRLAEQPLLAEWWQREVVVTGVQHQLDELMDRLQPLAATLGEEVVLALPAAALGSGGGPLVMARLQDPQTFARLLEAEVERVDAARGRPLIAVVDDPSAVVDDGVEVVVWKAGDLCAATTQPSLLADLAARRGDPSSAGFVGSRLYRSLEERYHQGVSWLVGIDIGEVMQQAAAHDDRSSSLLSSLGLLDAQTLVLERHRLDGRSATDAELLFAGPRRGMAAWLAAPAPMGSLGFVSPRATLAAAVVAKEPLAMFDELLAAVSRVDPTVPGELEQANSELGFDLRSDLAATVGGEAAFAVDGPLLPTPAWKLVVEVYDPGTFQATVERAVADVNRRLTELGRPSLALEVLSDGGRSYHVLRDPRSGFQVVWLMADGYLVAAPQRAILDQALGEHAAGITLVASDGFRALLPDNGYADCSAMLYRNLSGLTGSLGSALPPGALEAVGEPSLLCVYGEPERILLSATGGSLLGGIGSLGVLSAAHLVGGPQVSVSSPG